MRQLLVGEVIRSAAERCPGDLAVACEGRELTYGALALRSEIVAAALARRGIGRGDRVMWRGGNSVDAVALYFATAFLGAILVPVNPAFGETEVKPLLDLADPGLTVSDGERPADTSLADLLSERSVRVDDPTLDEEDPHVIFFTSGTTGSPKGVVLSQRTEVIRGMLGGMCTWPRGATICMFPQFHMAGWASPLEAWLSGEAVVYVDGGDTAGILDSVQRYRGHRLYCIPAVWRRILDMDLTRWDLASLGQADSGTSATTMELLTALRDALPWTTTTISYGSTEAGLVTRMGPRDVLRKPGSVGPPAPTVRVHMEEGELLVRSGHLMSGYFRDREATDAALRDGWFHTGELAEQDEEGFLRIVGRTREVIRTGGEWVVPEEVDAVLMTHPALADVAVAGVPDEHWGEIVTAFVVPKPGASVDLDGLRRHCGEHLSSYKHPRAVVVVDRVPRTATTGQVQRRLLVQRALLQ